MKLPTQFAFFACGLIVGFAIDEIRVSPMFATAEKRLTLAREQTTVWMDLAEEYKTECRELQQQAEAMP